ncbi:MAG: hypothetical protein N2321_07830 [Melioribacteraceae bacterium]|nr:hypothetical protein [Melioribacteraceae bacterium]
MANITSKIVDNVIGSLDKMKSPENDKNSFWSYLKEQLYSESTWDQKDLAVIENEIMKELDKLNNKDLEMIWELSDAAQPKLDEGLEVNIDEMKNDLVGDFVGKVLDRMDDNYSSSGFTSSYVSQDSPKKSSDDSDEEFSDSEEIDESEFEDFEDDEFFDEDTFDDDEENF